jgi:hypothetical protein
VIKERLEVREGLTIVDNQLDAVLQGREELVDSRLDQPFPQDVHGTQDHSGFLRYRD